MLKDLKRKNKYFHELRFDGTIENLLIRLPEKIEKTEIDFKNIILELSDEYN